MNPLPELRTQAWHDLLEHILIASDAQCRLWNKQDTQEAIQWLQRKYKRTLSPGFLSEHYDQAVIDSEVQAIIEARVNYLTKLAEVNNIPKKEDECHICGRRQDLSRYEFGLAEMVSVSRDWTDTIVSVAVAAVTVPLLGRALLHGPSKTKRAKILRLNLVLCPKCGTERRGGWFGKVQLTEADYSRHPWWAKARELGYNEFLKPSVLAEYKPA